MISLPRAAALLLFAATSMRMAADTSWVGDWNETGSMLGTFGILGSTLAGLALATHAHRNLWPLRSLRVPGSSSRMLVASVARPIAPSLVAWLGLSIASYGLTAWTTPHPSAPSALPLLASTLGVISTLTLAIAAGAMLHPALALPLVIAAGFVAPAALGSLEPSVPGNFSISTATSLAVQFAPVVSFYARQLALFAAITAGCALVVSACLRRRREAGTAIASALVIACAGALVATGPIERITDARTTTSARCAHDARIEVCVLSDHERFLPETLHAATSISAVMPAGLVPRRYVEHGLVTHPGDAVLDPSGIATDALSETVDAAATWRLCRPDVTADRPVWLAHRAGLLDELPDLDGLAAVRTADDTGQIAWWAKEMGPQC